MSRLFVKNAKNIDLFVYQLIYVLGHIGGSARTRCARTQTAETLDTNRNPKKDVKNDIHVYKCVCVYVEKYMIS